MAAAVGCGGAACLQSCKLQTLQLGVWELTYMSSRLGICLKPVAAGHRCVRGAATGCDESVGALARRFRSSAGRVRGARRERLAKRARVHTYYGAGHIGCHSERVASRKRCERAHHETALGLHAVTETARFLVT